LRERVKPARSRDAGNTMLSKEFAGGILIMTGANSAVGLRSKPARCIFLDEVDAYPASADDEGDPVSLAEARSSTSAFTLGLSLIRKVGRLVVFGVYKEPAQVDLNIFDEFKELNILGGHLAPFTYATALDLMPRGLIDGAACVTQTYGLAEFEAALDRTPAPGELQIKVLLDPQISPYSMVRLGGNSDTRCATRPSAAHCIALHPTGIGGCPKNPAGTVGFERHSRQSPL
jgi:threonine dehydrogenase-like Zn-dependent dehydrogenase